MPNLRIAYFSDNELEFIEQKVFELLEKRGVRMHHPEVLRLLGKAGARVDFGTSMVRFPKKFLLEQISSAPKTFALFGRGGKNRLELPRGDGSFHIRTNTGAQSWIEPDSDVYRSVTIEDIASWARLADRLDQIDFCAFQAASDVPNATADVHALRTMLQNIEKHVMVQPYTVESFEYLVKLSIVAAGGEEAVKSNPPVSFIACSLTPLDFTYMDLHIIMQGARYGIPLHLCSLPGAGATGPITEPGVVLLASAEILAMLATAQVIQPGIAVIATPVIFSTDMGTGRSLQASVESMRASALAVQFIKTAFEIPTHTYGIGSDSPEIDGQCSSEGALRSMLIGMSGTDILGAAGQIEVATTISPVQLVIDNEVFGMVRRIIEPMNLDDESMALEDLMDVEPGGEFLTTDHTLRHCRDGFTPKNFTRLSRDIWTQSSEINLVQRATEYYKKLMKDAGPISLSDEVIKEMDGIVKAADDHLTG
jgi:trimethylamine:corrinoid methyltransferase-like protein